MPAHPLFIGADGLAGCVVVGLLAGVLSAVLTTAVYAAEDAFARLPVVSREDRALVGMLGLTDLLSARSRILEAEQRRERVLGGRLRLPDLFGGPRRDSTAK